MKISKIIILLISTCFLASVASAQPVYEVTITNLTQAQSFTPILVASHKPSVLLFTVGQPASTELETLAEEGNTGPLTTALTADTNVTEVKSSAGLLAPGASVAVTVSAAGARRISVAAMLIPTNDAFFALNNVLARAPGGKPLVYFARAYDAGTEVNDELCASIPGPSFTECGGPGGGADVGGGEGFVHVHNGIHGVGDMVESTRDWRNDVARVEIRRVPSS